MSGGRVLLWSDKLQTELKHKGNSSILKTSSTFCYYIKSETCTYAYTSSLVIFLWSNSYLCQNTRSKLFPAHNDASVNPTSEETDTQKSLLTNGDKSKYRVSKVLRFTHATEYLCVCEYLMRTQRASLDLNKAHSFLIRVSAQTEQMWRLYFIFKAFLPGHLTAGIK